MDGRQQSQTDVAAASGGIIDEDNRSASVQEATCLERQNMGWLQLYTSTLLTFRRERTRSRFIQHGGAGSGAQSRKLDVHVGGLFQEPPDVV